MFDLLCVMVIQWRSSCIWWVFQILDCSWCWLCLTYFWCFITAKSLVSFLRRNRSGGMGIFIFGVYHYLLIVVFWYFMIVLGYLTIYWTSTFIFSEKEMLKNIFLDVKKKFETAMGILRKEKITIDPEDPAAVSQYAKVMKTIREK